MVQLGSLELSTELGFGFYWGLLVPASHLPHVGHTAHSARVYMRLSHMSLKIQYNF